MLNEAELRAQVAAKDERMKSDLWAREDGKETESWMAVVADADMGEPEEARAESGGDIGQQLEALSRAVETLTEAVGRRPTVDGVPAWLQAAAGDPLTYDAPDSARTAVCVRILPSMYSRLQQAQVRLGLRTTAGAWECLLRLGLAAAERLQT